MCIDSFQQSFFLLLGLNHRGILVAVINRNGHVIIPGGNDVIMEGDSVIIVTTHKNLTDLTDILE